jgi:microsomal dipeptidase-like Zn-dependent dipeptidase
MKGKAMIADLHCHYPMHLLPGDRDPHGPRATWRERIRDRLQAEAEGLLAHIVNDRSLDSGWRVDLKGLEEGGAKIVCSVLYWPPAEFDFAEKYGSAPLAAYFEDLKHQLEYVEADLRRQDPDGERVVIAKKAADLDDDKRIVFVHCVEGGFHLGPDPATVDAHVAWLAEQGVFYITLAHLFYRQVATNAPAIPMLTEGEYNAVFKQPDDEPLTELGEAAIKAMYKHKVLIDVSHMREDSLAATFKLVEQLDGESDDADAQEKFPLIATHVGMRDQGPGAQAYNLTPDTAKRIHERGGVIGLIMAQHQLGSTKDAGESRAVLERHLEAIGQACGDHSATAIGTDIDGFIKPTLEGIERAADLEVLEEWVRDAQPNDAEAILCGNAKRVIERAFQGR